jgi:hypothetical protein
MMGRRSGDSIGGPPSGHQEAKQDDGGNQQERQQDDKEFHNAVVHIDRLLCLCEQSEANPT